MAYTPTYTKDDFKEIIVDGMGTAGAEAVSWVDILVMFLVLGAVAGAAAKLVAIFK